jgi:hypothetical protein
MRSPEAELEVQAELPLLLHGVVSGDLETVDRVVAPLLEAGAGFKGECYDRSGRLLKEYRSGL